MAVRSACLARRAGPIVTGQETLLGQVPAGHTWLVREYVLQHVSPADALVVLSVRSSGQIWRLHRATQPSFNLLTVTGRHLVLRPGDELLVRLDVTGSPEMLAYVSGSDLLGVAG
jgi:hypothetical protein